MNSIAIVGSGPSGCFLAEILAMKLPKVRIDIYERLPFPFGLAVNGVAPDHLHTRKITEQFQRTLDRPEVNLICNTEIGADIPYVELKSFYDRVIFAVGAAQDRRLKIPGEQLIGVYGSGFFTRWVNHHPETTQRHPVIGKKIGIIGHGNVALDIARVISKTPQEHLESDLSPTIRERLSRTQIEEIHIIGRRGPADASFTLAELAELENLQQVSIHLCKDDLKEINLDSLPMSQQKMVQQLHHFAELNSTTPKKIQLYFHFNLTPSVIEGNNRVERLIVEHGQTGQVTALELDTLMTAIGYQTSPIPDVPYDETTKRLAHQDSLIESGVYCVGWCQRGPQGVIPTNRSEAMSLARRIIKELETDNVN